MNADTRMKNIDDEISLWELLSYLKNGWHWLFGGAVFGLIAAFGVVFSMPTLYEARAVIQPATIGMIAETTTTSMTVEPVAQTLERLNLVTYYTDDIVKRCGIDSAEELAARVNASLIKGNSLISISYRAKSAELARTCVSMIVGKLARSLHEIKAPLIKELEDQMMYTKQQVEFIERFLAASDRRTAQSSTSNELSILMMLKREELMKLQKTHREQRIQLTEPLTQPLKLLEPIYASENPVSAKKLTATAVGLLGGLLVGLFGLFFFQGWRSYRSIST